jgi:hypothetical protein
MWADSSSQSCLQQLAVSGLDSMVANHNKKKLKEFVVALRMQGMVAAVVGSMQYMW